MAAAVMIDLPVHVVRVFASAQMGYSEGSL